MTPAASVLVEACVDTAESARAAEAGGAGRVELCADLLQGGTTPSAGTIAVTREAVAIPVFVLVRPRPGDFLYSREELSVMQRDIDTARALGADGVVLGALTAAGDVDVERLRALVDAARPMRVTFHRAFDLARDPLDALESLAALGVDRVLTSGGAPTALEGVATLAELVRLAAGRVGILAGGGITESTAAAIVAGSGVRELHVRGAETVGSAMRHRRAAVTFARPAPADEYSRVVTSAERIRMVVQAGNAATADGGGRTAERR